MSVCLSVDWLTRKPHGRTSLNFCACCLWLWLGSPLICTSGFVDDVMFSPWRVMCTLKRRWNTTSITAVIPTKFCSMIKTASTYFDFHIGGEVCCLRLRCCIHRPAQIQEEYKFLALFWYVYFDDCQWYLYSAICNRICIFHFNCWLIFQWQCRPLRRLVLAYASE